MNGKWNFFLSSLNEKPKKFENVEVYSGPSDLTPASGVTIRHLVFGERPSYKYLIDTFPNWGEEYEISFKYQIDRWPTRGGNTYWPIILLKEYRRDEKKGDWNFWKGSSFILEVLVKASSYGRSSTSSSFIVYTRFAQESDKKKIITTKSVNLNKEVNTSYFKPNTWNFMKILQKKFGRHVRKYMIHNPTKYFYISLVLSQSCI